MLNEANTASLFPLVVKDLCYLANNKVLIDQLTFSIERPGLSAIMGPNGAGKSLSLRLLHGLIAPSRGTISWAGVTNGSHVRARQAMVFQKPVLLRRTVRDNLVYALNINCSLDKSLHEELIGEALKRAGLTGHTTSPARRLSGGEQQRLAMARALMHRPALLFLDEPTSSLDPNATQAVEALIEQAVNQGTKVILVTHDIGQARRLSDEILFLNNGRLVEQGPTNEILSGPQSRAAQQYFSGEIVI